MSAARPALCTHLSYSGPGGGGSGVRVPGAAIGVVGGRGMQAGLGSGAWTGLCHWGKRGGAAVSECGVCRGLATAQPRASVPRSHLGVTDHRLTGGDPGLSVGQRTMQSPKNRIPPTNAPRSPAPQPRGAGLLSVGVTPVCPALRPGRCRTCVCKGMTLPGGGHLCAEEPAVKCCSDAASPGACDGRGTASWLVEEPGAQSVS